MSALSALTSATLNARPSAASSTTSSGGAQAFDFMKLLITQMKNQNPLEPQNGADFMMQIAQLSQVDSVNKMNQNISDMLTLQNLTQSTALIGKTVSYTNAAGAAARGVVSSVTMNSGKVQLMIGSTTVDMSQVRTVEAGPRTV